MNFASSTRAAENRTRWKRIIANSSVVPEDRYDCMANIRLVREREYIATGGICERTLGS